MIGQLRDKLWANETSRDLSLKCVSNGYPILHKAPDKWYAAYCQSFTQPVITYSQMDQKEQISVKFESKHKHSLRKYISNVVCKMSAIFFSASVSLSARGECCMYKGLLGTHNGHVLSSISISISIFMGHTKITRWDPHHGNTPCGGVGLGFLVRHHNQVRDELFCTNSSWCVLCFKKKIILDWSSRPF